MAFVGQPRASEARSLLGVPGLSSVDVDEDECEVVIGIRPKSSPLPRRRSSEDIEDFEPEPPLSGSRRVSFADAKGLSLVQVKKFDTWDVPKLPGCDSSEGEGTAEEKYFISPLTFSLPLPTEELYVKVREQKLELETIELLPGTTILRGVIRVLNISFNKAVYVRTSLNTWSSHFDLLAEYMPGSNDSLMDLFSFKLTLVPPFAEQGARVDFCLRYETPVGTFWANNNDRNYVLFCHQRAKERKGTPQSENVNKKSCLKTISHNFSTVESISAMEASPKENISTDVSKHGEEVDTVKAQQISDGQSGTSEEMKQRSLAESRRNCSRRSRRKAARMTRVKDYFSQKNGGVDDPERDESPPETKLKATQEGSPEEKHSEVRSFPDGSGKSEGSESLETCSEPLLEPDTSPAHDNSETEKSESINLAITGAESATDIRDSPSSDEPAPAECQDMNKSVSKAEEPADSVTSAVSSESLVSQANSFTFGTVVAPLYHQVFGRVGSESQSGGDWGNPALNVGDVTQSYPHAERRHTSCTDVRSNDDKVQESVIKTQESNQESLDATLKSPPMVEEETSLTANDIQDHVESLRDPADICSDKSRTNTSDRDVHPNNLDTDLLNPQSLHPQGKAQEDNLTYDLQLPELTCTQTNQDEILRQSKTLEVKTSLENSFMSHTEIVSGETDQQTSVRGANDCSCVHESNKADVCKFTSITNEEKLLDALQDLNPNHINSSATKETEKSYGSYFEIAEEKDVITPQILESSNVEEGKNLHKDETKHSVEITVTGEVGESTTQATISNDVHGDTRKIEHEMEAADFCLADATEVNWEKMVEEEEKNVLTDEGESEAVSLKTVEEDQELLEDTGIETASETRDATEAEKEETEDENRIKDEEIGVIMAGKNGEEAEEELDYVQAAKTAGEEKTEEQEETELEKEKHFIEMQEVGEEDTKEMEIDLNSDDEADVQWEDQVKREENAEEENPNDEEEILVDETGEAEIVDAGSESVTIEDRENEAGCFEERLDIAPDEVEDGLPASVNNVQDKSVSDKENGLIPTEMHLYKEEDFQKNLAHDVSNAERDENDSEGNMFIFTDEPESDDGAASGESDSDDEVELYMHCLRAVHTGEQAQKDRNKDTGFSVGRRPSVSRSKRLSSPMPSISESLDEEQHFGCLQDNHEDMETADFQPTAAALPASSGQESISIRVAWWKETFSCSNIAKTLLCATLLVVFVVVAYRYDFLACFGLYLMSVVWLYYHGDRKPEQQKQQQQQNRLN